MGNLQTFLRYLFTGRSGRPSGGGAAQPQRPREMADYLRLLEEHPGTRITTVKLLGKNASKDNVLLIKEHVETEDRDGNARQIDVLNAPTCDFGHLLDQQVRPAAVCQICGRLMCSVENCTGWCAVCGKACCATHRSTYEREDERAITFCLRHRWRRFVAWFWSYS